MYLKERAPESEQGVVLDLGDSLGKVKTNILFTTLKKLILVCNQLDVQLLL
jgi:hypothetical protein